jgi:hypothetical protein
MCLAEQLADTYKKAKSELVQSLSFTLMGIANCTKKILPDMSEHSILSSHYTDSALMLHMMGNVNTHNYVDRPYFETMLSSFVGTPPGSTKNDEVFIPDAEVGDPDIHTAEDTLATRRLPAARIDSVSEGDSLGIIHSGSDGSDDLDDRSDDDDEEEEEEEDEDEYEDGEQQEKNQMIRVANTAKNHEKENISEKEETMSKQTEEELAKGLNPDANEFKPLEVVVPEHEELKSHSEGNVEEKTAARIVPAPVDNIHLTGTASGKSYAVNLLSYVPFTYHSLVYAYTVEPVHNNIGFCDTSSVVSYSVVPTNFSLLTATLYFSVRTALVCNDTKYSVRFMALCTHIHIDSVEPILDFERQHTALKCGRYVTFQMFFSMLDFLFLE